MLLFDSDKSACRVVTSVFYSNNSQHALVFFRRGGWILDNFPETKEQWSMLFERNVILPDCILALQDNSPNGEVLIKRWYMSDKDSIDRQISDRLDRERYERQMQEEEK